MNEKIKELRFDVLSAKDYFLKRLAYTLGPAEVKAFMEKEDVQIIDVRRTEDYLSGHIPTAISMPKSEIPDNLDKISKEKLSIVYCYNQQCHLGEAACLVFADYGYPVMLMEGGYKAWVDDFRFAVTE